MVIVTGEINNKITTPLIEIKKICIARRAIDNKIKPKINDATNIITPKAPVKNPAIIIKIIFGIDILPA